MKTLSLMTSRVLMVILATLFLCVGLTSCGDEEGPEPDPPTNTTSKPYKDYIGTQTFTSDYAQFIDLMAAAEAYKHALFLAYYDNEKGGFGKDEPTDAALSDLTKRAEYIAELYDAAEPALERLIDKGVLETPTVQSRGFGWVLNLFGFFGLVKNTGEDCRKCVVGVLAQCPDPDRTGQLLFEATPEYRKGATDYKTWMKNFIEGKYDNAGARIFEFWYSNSESHDLSVGNDFFNKCNQLDITPKKNLASRAVDLWAAGAKFVVSVMQEAAPVPGMNSNNIKDALNGSKEALEKLAPALITSTTAAAANATTNLLSKDRSGTTEKQKATKQQCEDAMNKYYEDLNNKSKPKSQQTTVKVKDSDKQTPAKSAIVSDKDDDRVVIGIGASSDGSIEVPVATDKKAEVTVTAVDATGDKYTAETTVTPGKTTEVDVTTNEKSIIDKDNKVPEPGKLTVDKKSLTFTAEGGKQTVTMDIGDNHWYGGYIEGDENDDWVSVEAPDHTRCIVTVKANTTGEERKANLIIFATNNDDAEELTDPGVVYFRIPVTQEAGESDLFARMYIDLDFSAAGSVTNASVDEWIGQSRNQDHRLRIPIGAGDQFDEDWSLMAPCKTHGTGRYRTVRAKGTSTSTEGAYVGNWTQTYDVDLTVDMQPGVDDLDAQISGGHIVVHETCDDRITADYDLRLGRFPYETHLDGYAEYYFKAYDGQQTTYITSLRIVQTQVDSGWWSETTWTGWSGGGFNLAIELINPAGESMYDVKGAVKQAAPHSATAVATHPILSYRKLR